ncbi:MAG: universal stress protein [Caldilineaceae bacterium]|jgi:nucleotide-binding universal stress UspA family protein
MYRRILVPLDGSSRAEAILPYVEELGHVHGSTIIFLQVVEPGAAMMTPYDVAPYYDADLDRRWEQEARTYLKSLCGEYEAKRLRSRCIVERGPIVRTILDVAKHENADLIAMASHGRSGLARVFYGSVAAGILQQADRPLLLVRACGK